MNSKGPSLVDLETAEPAPSRRSLIGAAGAAGLVGAAAALLGGFPATAAAPTPPDRPTDADRTALEAAMRLELAAMTLYQVAAEELPEDIAAIATLMAEQHQAYANSISGAIGIASDGIDQGVVDMMSGDFATSDPQAFAAAARTLENTAVATHTQLVGEHESTEAIELTAAILTVESRHAVVLTSLAGFASNLDEMLGNSATALSLTGGAA